MTGAAGLRLQPFPGRLAPYHHPLEVKGHLNLLAETLDEVGVGIRLGAQAVVDMGARQRETQRRTQITEDVEQRHRVGAARDGDQDGLAALEQPMAANAVEDARGETTGIQTRRARDQRLGEHAGSASEQLTLIGKCGVLAKATGPLRYCCVSPSP